jgi:hypothetical protein
MATFWKINGEQTENESLEDCIAAIVPPFTDTRCALQIDDSTEPSTYRFNVDGVAYTVQQNA